MYTYIMVVCTPDYYTILQMYSFIKCFNYFIVEIYNLHDNGYNQNCYNI